MSMPLPETISRADSLSVKPVLFLVSVGVNVCVKDDE